ncbi:DUF2530 domain-containing protein [Actinomadura sp. KC345]|uniref:DUF2530 domain-containing protein n=1 Tax=Actinomadura sp. KC345 TaxID=2530371 RepID=UPI001053B50C|nr:DUF2530 domain-containing protein [Actinomadura sp. KC345]
MTRPHRPDPPPMQTNDVRIAAAGTAAWAVALVVLLIVGLPSEDRWWLWVCVAGIAIGLFAVWYVPRLQAGRARQEAARAAEREAALREGPPDPSPGPSPERPEDAETSQAAGSAESSTDPKRRTAD